MNDKIKDIYTTLIETGDGSGCIVTLQENMVDTLIYNLVDEIRVSKKCTIDTLNALSIDLEYLKYIIEILQYLFNNTGEDNIIPDSDYDIIGDAYLKLSGNNIIGAVNSGDRKTAFHKYPDLRGTLDKVYWVDESSAEDDRDTIHHWMNRLFNRYGIPFDTGVDIVLLPKWDGVSLIFENDENGVCQRALTRGDVVTNKAMDLSDFFKGIKFEPVEEGKPFGLKTECVVSDEQFKNLNKVYKTFKTNRNAVSGVLNNKDISKELLLENITIKPLQYQVEGNAPKLAKDMLTDRHLNYKLSFSNITGLSSALSVFRTELYTLGIDFDGVVIRIVDDSLQKKAGRTDHINNYEVAFKFPAPNTITTIENVVFQTGLLGLITPVAKITPTEINGKVVSSVSLGSIERFKSLGLSKGDDVKLLYDIIPYINFHKSNGGEKFKVIDTCPVCGELLTEQPLLGCYNRECDSNKIGKINNYCIKMDIPNISVKRITLLYEHGLLDNISDLYMLQTREAKFKSIKGLGKKIFDNIVSSINSRKDVYDYTILGSVGIRGVGRKIFKKISSIYYINELQDICISGNYDKLIEMEGIQYDKAMKIVNGVIENMELINFLCSILHVKKLKDVRDENTEGKVHVCFTGVRDKELKAHLIESGIIVVESYSNKVDVLICKDDYMNDKKSSKVKKAEKADKTILELSEAYKLFGFKK